MSNDEIRELIQLVLETGIAELELQRGENRVRIRRAGTSQKAVVPSGVAPTSATEVVHQQASTAAASTAAASVAPTGGNEYIVKSPIVGTFYETPKPGDPPFVKVGDVVEPGHVLCIIESMKLMNEIESDIAGTIVAKLMENGRPVEYGEALFAIRPR
jgi:acetyl-CoA carboxylase biotin carboxyl carrier protein